MTQFHEAINPEQPRQLSVEQLMTTQIQPGDIVDGLIDESALDSFESAIFEKISGCKPDKFSWTDANHSMYGTLSEEIKPRAFIGTLHNSSALVLPGTHESYYNPKNHATIPPLMKFLVSGELHHNRRGDLGIMAREVTYRTDKHIPSGVKRTLNTNTLSASTAEAYVKSLNWESIATARVLASIAFAETVSAGLPTLGKSSR